MTMTEKLIINNGLQILGIILYITYIQYDGRKQRTWPRQSERSRLVK
jgi:hypothetical protein